MAKIRTLLFRNPALAAVILALALAIKGLVPAGYMPVASGKSVTIAVCDGNGDTVRMAIAVPGRQGDGDPAKERAGLAAHCPFTTLSLHGLSVDAPQVTAPPAFAEAPVPPALPQVLAARPLTRLPPSRGPPALS